MKGGAMSRPVTAEAIRAEDWAGEMGERWLANLDRFESMIAPVGDALLAHAGFHSGERVIDVGCGGGATSRAIAAAVAPGGSVLGLDISPALVAEAARRGRAAGIANLQFEVGDAATARPTGAPFDRLFSRFGSMFFAEPAAAFGNLRSMLRPGGRADFGVWGPGKQNAWIAGLMGVVRQHMDLPAPVPRAPGPFALDDPDYFRELLTGAGFTGIEFQLWQGEQLIGGAGATPDEAARFVLESMSFADALREGDPALRARIEAGVRELFAAHHGPAGVSMGAIAWFVSARA